MKFHHFYPKFREYAGVFSDSFKLFAVIHLGLTYGYSFSFCVGPSMLPTINEKGDLVFIDHLSYSILQNDYKRGDVVICVSPYDRRKNVCKRITGVEGDMMTIRSNSFPYSEVVIIPRGHVWLAGDNPNNSTDSRQYGPVSMGLIHGRVMAKMSTSNFWSDPFTIIPNGPPPYLKKKVSNQAVATIENKKLAIEVMSEDHSESTIQIKKHKNKGSDEGTHTSI
jgi:mitochondrial inner membrane protease subunit 1